MTKLALAGVLSLLLWSPVIAAPIVYTDGFRFHDCRHTFASRLVNDGVDRYVMQATGGWKTASMMQRYAHLEPMTIRAAVERPSSGQHGVLQERTDTRSDTDVL